MTKTAGLGDQLYVDGYNLSGSIGAIQSLVKSYAEQVVTGLDLSAEERILLLADGEIGFANYYDPVHPGLHAILSDLPDTNAIVSYFRGSLLGAVTATLLGKQVNYGLARGSDGSLIGANIAVKGSGYGLEYGYALTPGIYQSVAAESLIGLDGDLSGYNGGSNDPTVFVLHIFDMVGVAGDDITVQIEHSDDGDIDIVADDDAILLVTDLLNDHSYTPDGIGYSALHTRLVSITITDTAASIVAGTLTITGTDAAGAPQDEDVDIGSGAGVYTTINRYKTVTNVTTKDDVVVLGGGGDETIKVGVFVLVSTYANLIDFTNVDLAVVPATERITEPVVHCKRFTRVTTVTVSNYPTTSVDFAVAQVRGVPL